IERTNFDLANDIRNLVNRTNYMINKYFDGELPSYTGAHNEIDENLESVVKQSIEEYEKEMENMKFNNALRAVWTIISRSNKYIDETAPWVLAKDEAKKDELGNVMVHLAENIRITAVLLQPYFKNGPKQIIRKLKNDTNQ